MIKADHYKPGVIIKRSEYECFMPDPVKPPLKGIRKLFFEKVASPIFDHLFNKADTNY